MPELRGLPDIKAPSLPALFFHKPSEIKMKTLNLRIAYTTAGCNGAINVYKDDNGIIRCSFHRYCKTIEDSKLKTLKEAKTWLLKWMPEML